MALAVLISRHRGPLTADLHRFHGVRLAKLEQSGFTLAEIAAFAVNLPPDSAVAIAARLPDSHLTTETFLLREIELALKVLIWQQTKDAQSRQPQNYPIRIPLTAAEADAQKPKQQEYDVSTIEEMNEFLGWAPEVEHV